MIQRVFLVASASLLANFLLVGLIAAQNPSPESDESGPGRKVAPMVVDSPAASLGSPL